MMSHNFRNVTSWTLYDFANTIFSAIVLTAYFPLYYTEWTGSKWSLGVVTTSAMVLAGIVIPFAGALSDQTGKTKAYLVRMTLACIACLTLLAFSTHPKLLLGFYLLSCFFYHTCLVFYNSLLPVVASPEKQGRVSGLGTGLGYLGVVIALPIANAVENQFGGNSVFILAGVLFFLFALPLMLWVPERSVENPKPFAWRMLFEEWRKVLALFKELPARPHLLLFFGANFFIVDALNTMILWFLVYARETFRPENSQLIGLLMIVNVTAFISGVFAGLLADKIGAMKTMLLAALTLVITLFLMPGLESFKTFSLVCMVGGAFSIAGIWTTGRKVLIELAPKNQIGEYFGVFGLTLKISVVGNLFFSIVADVVNFQAAFWLLLFPAGIGFLMLAASAWLRKTANGSTRLKL